MSQRHLDEATLERAQAKAHVGVWVVDPTSLDVMWSDELFRLLDLDPETDELTWDAIMARVPPEDRRMAEEAFVVALRGDWSGRLELPIESDGTIRWIDWFGGQDDRGRFVGLAQDSTERRADVARLEAEQARSDVADAISGLGWWEIDSETNTVTWSKQIYELVGEDPETFVPEFDTVLKRIAPEHRATAEEFLARLAAGDETGRMELAVRRRDGERRWVEVRWRMLGDLHHVGVVQDITERRQREEELRLQVHILEAMSECLALIRARDGLVLWCNPEAAATVGLTVDEAIGLHIADFTAPGQDAVLDDMRQHLRRGEPWQGEFEQMRADGSRFPADARLYRMDHALHGPIWLSISHDITDTKARERALHESRQHLQAVQDHAPTGIALIGLDGTIEYVNDALCTLLGEERAVLEQRSVLAEERMCPVEVETWAALAAGETSSGRAERRYERRDGTVVWAMCTASLVRYPDGSPKSVLVHVVDISDRKALEERLRQQTLELERANQATTSFLARTSHELRTPLNAVLGFGQLLLSTDLSPEDRMAAEQIVHAGRHLVGLIDEILDITRVESGVLELRIETVDVGDLIAEAVELVKPMATDTGVAMSVVEHRTSLTGPFVRGDRRRIAQVLLNLLSNAIKYNRLGGSVTVTVTPEPERVRIAVADTGRGIPAEQIGRLFQPFERLGIDREDIEGTGIGLALARALAEDMGGTITAESVDGQGSTFTIELPAAAPPEAAPPAEPAPAAVTARSPGPGAERSLRMVNVEDNPANQQLVQAIMGRRADVELWTAPDGTTGLAQIHEHEPDLVLLDLDLPDIPGDEILRQLRAERPTAPPVIVVCSADANPSQIEALLALGADDYLTKPFEIPALLALVDAVTPAADTDTTEGSAAPAAPAPG